MSDFPKKISEALRIGAEESAYRLSLIQGRRRQVTTWTLKIAEALGLDPKKDFIDYNFAGYDLSGEDLSEFVLTGADFALANLQDTEMPLGFDPKTVRNWERTVGSPLIPRKIETANSTHSILFAIPKNLTLVRREENFADRRISKLQEGEKKLTRQQAAELFRTQLSENVLHDRLENEILMLIGSNSGDSKILHRVERGVAADVYTNTSDGEKNVLLDIAQNLDLQIFFRGVLHALDLIVRYQCAAELGALDRERAKSIWLELQHRDFVKSSQFRTIKDRKDPNEITNLLLKSLRDNGSQYIFGHSRLKIYKDTHMHDRHKLGAITFVASIMSDIDLFKLRKSHPDADCIVQKSILQKTLEHDRALVDRFVDLKTATDRSNQSGDTWVGLNWRKPD